MPMSTPNRRLGSLPPDPRLLALAPQHSQRFAVLRPPPVVDRSAIELDPVLGQNDTLPDCTCVGLMNAARMVAAINGFQLAAREEFCKIFYADVIGCPPIDEAIAATDGAYCLDVLTKQATQGFPCGMQTELVGLYGVIPHTKTSIANSIAHLGHCYLGVELRERDMEDHKIWDIQDERDDGAIIGGHVLVIFDYLGLGSGDTVRLATWGYWQKATWSWLLKRTTESYGLVWRQLLGADGLHDGVDADALARQLAIFSYGSPITARA